MKVSILTDVQSRLIIAALYGNPPFLERAKSRG